jgi:PAS domain S-box-containing protein
MTETGVHREIAPPDAQSELERLRHQLSLYEDIVRSLPLGFIFIDEDDRVAMVNPMGEEIRCVGERKGAPVSECHPPGTHEMLEKVMTNFRETPPEEHHPIVLERMHRYEVSYSRVSGEDGGYRGVLWLAHDISRRKQLEQELLHAERLAGLGRMAAKVAHDIKNPLNAIQGAAHHLQRVIDDGEAGQLTALIKEQVARITELLDRLNALTRPLQPELEETDPVELLRSQMRACELAHPEGSCAVRIEGEVPAVRWDVNLVERLIQNAAENAFQAMAGGGELSVTVGLETLEDGSWVVLRFQDSGPGFPAEVLENLYQPFVTTRPDGTGLGLTIMREICLLHGGDLSVENNEGGALVSARLRSK